MTPGPPRRRRRRHGRRLVSTLGILLVAAGGTMLGAALATESHAPQPGASQAGSLQPTIVGRDTQAIDPSSSGRVAGGYTLPGPAAGRLELGGKPSAASGPVLARSVPVSIAIPSIGVHARLLQVGLNRDGTLQVPPLYRRPSLPAWYRYSPTPGQPGPSIIVGHVDDYLGPAVFFKLGALVPGARIDVTLRSGVVAVFEVDGVRRYAKASFPTERVYGPTDYAALRLLTCGGPFDEATRSYLDNVVVFASLVGSVPRAASG